jgi:hypothetical protein
MRIYSVAVGAKVSAARQTDGQADTHADVTKSLVAVGNFANTR